MATRSVRNNNPGNLRIGANWKGLQPPHQMTPAQEAEHAFCVFHAPEWGFRALALLLRNYGRDGLETVAQVIARFAPSNENNTNAYVADVSARSGFAPHQIIDLQSRPCVRALSKAIATHETGGWDGLWRDADLDSGLDMAFGR